MQDKLIKLDAGRAWTDAMALLRSQREILLTLTGFFIMLPMLMLLMLRWPDLTGANSTATMAKWDSWSGANSHWLLLVALVGAFGRATMLVLAFDPSRPTVGAALASAARQFLWFYLAGLLVSLMQSGGLFLFVIPGLYLIGRMFVAEPALVAEGITNPLKAVARSFELTRGNGWRIFGVNAIIAIGAFVFLLAVSSVIGVVAALLGVGGLGLFLSALTVAIVFSGVYLALLLVGVAAYRQLADDRHVRSGALG